jgi:hypothetical protein
MTFEQTKSVPVILRQRVIINDGLVFDAEREVTLPIEPFVGMVLYNPYKSLFDPAEDEMPIEEIACYLKTGQVFCYLPIDDFRPESSGSRWAEEDVLKRFQDWKLKRDERCRPAHERNGQ